MKRKIVVAARDLTRKASPWLWAHPAASRLAYRVACAALYAGREVCPEEIILYARGIAWRGAMEWEAGRHLAPLVERLMDRCESERDVQEAVTCLRREAAYLAVKHRFKGSHQWTAHAWRRGQERGWRSPREAITAQAVVANGDGLAVTVLGRGSLAVNAWTPGS